MKNSSGVTFMHRPSKCLQLQPSCVVSTVICKYCKPVEIFYLLCLSGDVCFVKCPVMRKQKVFTVRILSFFIQKVSPFQNFEIKRFLKIFRTKQGMIQVEVSKCYGYKRPLPLLLVTYCSVEFSNMRAFVAVLCIIAAVSARSVQVFSIKKIYDNCFVVVI